MIPEHIIIGDDLKFTVYSDLYATDTRVMKLMFYTQADYKNKIVEVTGVNTVINNKQAYTFTVPAAITSKLVEQTYVIKVCFTSPFTTTITSKMVRVARVDILNDDIMQYEKIINAIDATMLGRATTDQMGYTIGNRAISRIPLPELLQMKREYKRELNTLREKMKRQEALATGGTYVNKNIIKYKFK